MVRYGSVDLKGKFPYEVLQWPRDRNMAITSKHTCILTDPFSTIQAATASAEQTFSAPKINKIYLCSTRIQDRQLLTSTVRQGLNCSAEEKFTSVSRRTEFHFN
jgi:hypothetical protein